MKGSLGQVPWHEALRGQWAGNGAGSLVVQDETQQSSLAAQTGLTPPSVCPISCFKLFW